VTERRSRGHGQIRTEALCQEDLLYQETKLELSQFGNLEEEVVCQSEETVSPIPPTNQNLHAFPPSANVRVRRRTPVCESALLVRPPDGAFVFWSTGDAHRPGTGDAESGRAWPMAGHRVQAQGRPE
jgi:hypothetical protein